jgi:hypothetical protein
MSDGPSFRCRLCGRVSYHPKDIEHAFCGVCGFTLETAPPDAPGRDTASPTAGGLLPSAS